MNKFICIHGHFYQPPRENPFTGKIPFQESSHPFSNWNEKINFECYSPNAFSRVLNLKGQIIKLINNYEYISFNFGPTLIDWLQRSATETYRAIVEADKRSVKKFNGHGSAVAQVYSHVIMPLANLQDKEIQVKWGIKDFIYHFDRYPEGMWLAEAAVDTETLEVLADNGIKFTILSPHQAESVKYADKDHFEGVNGNSLNTNFPYFINLPSGKKIIIFFYNGTVSHDLSFGNLLVSGDNLVERLYANLDFKSDGVELTSTALDGETFGHHHKLGDMALAYGIDRIRREKKATICNYGAFLDFYEPVHEVKIKERTAWSCIHGVERWNSNCGCCTSPGKGWQQNWRKPLREGLNALNQRTDKIFVEKTADFFSEGEARGVLIEYIDIINKRDKESFIDFFEKHIGRRINARELTLLCRLYDLKKNCQLMFTSCAWFFDDISGIEAIQVMSYADRVLALCKRIINKEEFDQIRDEFKNYLHQAESNFPNMKNGENVYNQYVLPSRQALDQVGIKHAFNYLYDDLKAKYDDPNIIVRAAGESLINEFGYQKIVSNMLEITSQLTFSTRYFYFTIIQIGRANVLGYYSIEEGKDLVDKYLNEIKKVNISNIPETIELLSSLYQGVFNIEDITPDAKSYFLSHMVDNEIKIVDRHLEDIYLRNFPLNSIYMKFQNKLSHYMLAISEMVLVKKLIDQLAENVESDKIIQTKNSIKYWNINYSSYLEKIQNLSQTTLFHKIKKFINDFGDLELLSDADKLITSFEDLKLNLNLWNSQNAILSFLSKQKEQVKILMNTTEDFRKLFERLVLYLNIDIKATLK